MSTDFKVVPAEPCTQKQVSEHFWKLCMWSITPSRDMCLCATIEL